MKQIIRITICPFLLLLGLFLANSVNGQQLVGDSISKQRPIKIKRMANRSMEYNDWYSSIELLEIYVQKRPKNLEARYDLGSLYYKTRRYAEAENTFHQLILKDSNSYPKAWFYRGKALKSLGKYDDAKVCFEQFKSRYRGLKDRRAYLRLYKAEMASFEFIDSITSNPLPAEVISLDAINGKHTESGLMPLSESEIYYTKLPTDQLPIIKMNDTAITQPFSKIYSSTLVSGEWQKGTQLESEINELGGHIGNPALSHDEKSLFFSVCEDDWRGETRCKIYQSKKVNDKWRKPEELKNGINLPNTSSTQPALGRDPLRNRYILYFVSDRTGGKGGLDIWYTRYNKRDNEWDKPRNCGSKINTVGNEETPWIDLKENTIYFSSDGHPGIGGMDIYKCIGERSRWTEPELLGAPINSPADDVYFRKELRERYQLLTSNRSGSQTLWNSTCCDDIYEIFYPENFESIIRLTAFELDQETGVLNRDIPLQETIFKLYRFDPKTKEKYLVKTDTAVQGEVFFSIEPGKQYVVEGGLDGYFSDIQNIDGKPLRAGDTIQAELGLKKWDDKPITIPNIYFGFNSDELTEDSKLALDTSIFQLMVDNPSIVIELMAHTDNKGTNSYNKKLSQKRAESVRSYLLERGIDDDRITAKGYGESQPIAPNEMPDGSDNPEGRAKNRRVEFRITGTKLQIFDLDD